MDLVGAIYKQLNKSARLAARETRIESAFIFHGSEAGDCKRKIYLRHINAKREKDDRPEDQLGALQLLFSDGFRHQESVISVLKQCPNIHITNEEEGRFIPLTFVGVPEETSETTIFISGHPDAIAHDVKEKKRLVIEVKGLNHFSFQKLKNENIDTLKDVYPTAIPQARVYCMMYETDYAVVLVKNKNTSQLCQFTIERDEEIETRIKNKFIAVASAILLDSMPNCDYLKGDPRCRFCPYPSSCGSDNG